MIVKNSIAETYLQNDLNEEQLKAAQMLNNAVVAAGAGSGKTRVISYRYAYLVCVCGYKPSEILTLTFTDKATTQMHEKIYEVLKMISESPEKDASIKRAEKALEEFQDARIQTLDSYASSIVKSQGRLYGISPNFTIDLAKAHDFAQSKAIPFALKHRKNTNLQEFIHTKNVESTIQGLFANLVITHSSIVHPIDFESQFQKQKALILEKYEQNIQHFSIAIHDTKNLLDEITDKKTQSLVGYKNLIIFFNTIGQYEFPSRKTMELLFEKNHDNTYTITVEKIKETLFTALDVFFRFKKLSPGGNDPNITEIKKIIFDSRPLYDELTSIVEYCLNAESIQELCLLLNDFQNEFNTFKRTNLTLTYKDVSDLALEILTQDYAMRESEKKRYKAIMIDEFQDNNDDQKKLLFLLAEKPKDKKDFKPNIPHIEDLDPQKLFFVGDEKQSIYRFRGADVRVFRKLQELFDSSTKLNTNYRSHQSLISSFNSIFGGQNFPQTNDAFFANQKEQSTLSIDPFAPSIFLKENHIKKDLHFPEYEAHYEEIYAKPIQDEKAKRDFLEPRIHFCFTIKNTNQEIDEDEKESENDALLTTDEIEAFFITKKIKEIVDNSHGEVNYSDIAILFRTYTKQNYYEKYLRSFGIPYISESIKSFFNDAPVNDLLSILKLLIFPHDSLSFANFFHSPFSRLPLSTVHKCIHFIQNQNEQNKESQELFPKSLFENLSQEEHAQLKEAQQRFENLEALSHTKTVSELLSHLWYTEGYRYETVWNESVHIYTELYDFLFEIARKIDEKGGSLIDFVEYLSRIESGKTKLESMDIPLEREGAVRMMSIHKSKGLEFPIVFVCGVQSSGQRDKNDKEFYFDDEFGISLNFKKNLHIKEGKNNYFYLQGKKYNDLQAKAELRRLLYVAMTRAEQRLFITGSFSITKEESKKIPELYSEEEETSKKITALLALKTHTALEKKEKNEDSLFKDGFSDPDYTFFSFLHPILTYFGERSNVEDALPFTLEEIPSYTEDEYISQRKTSREKLYNAQERVKKIYETIEVEHIPEPRSLYLSPSLFTNTVQDKNTNSELIPEVSKYSSFNNAIDAIISSTELKSEDFGTIAHAYLEAAIKKTPPQIPKNILSRINPKDENTLKEIAKKMSENFFETALGEKLKTATWVESELAYIHLVENPQTKEHRLIKGSIDLVFKDQKNEQYFIIDFKTDSTIQPSKHLTQLYFYKEAVTKMKQIPSTSVRSYIFYLRYNKAIELTKEIETIDPNLFS